MIWSKRRMPNCAPMDVVYYSIFLARKLVGKTPREAFVTIISEFCNELPFLLTGQVSPISPRYAPQPLLILLADRTGQNRRREL
jgi:hypothetical protein